MGAFKENAKLSLKVFLSNTGMHGFAYLDAWQNRWVFLFWAVTVLFSLTWAMVNCVNSFLAFIETPVIIKIDNLRYTANKVKKGLLLRPFTSRLTFIQVPYPALTFCPVQDRDELHLASLIFDQFKFVCHGDNPGTNGGLESCQERPYQAIRRPGSPFFKFLVELETMVDTWPDQIGLPSFCIV